MRYDIFISYKRKSLPTANNLYYRLTTRGYSTFFDLEELGRDNFNTQLLNYIDNAKDVFVILEEGSLDGCKEENWKEEDWFCHEIAYALEKKKNIIPILIGGFNMPPKEFFPNELQELSLKNAPEFNFSYFEAYINKLIEKDYLLSIPNLQEKATSVFKFYSNENCQVFKDGKLVSSIEGMSDEPYYLPVPRKGDFRFQVFNSITGEKKVLKEHIDADEEREIDIEWESHKPYKPDQEWPEQAKITGESYLVDLGPAKFNMIRVNGGNMMIGATQEQEQEAELYEYPAHEIHLPTYYIGEFPVTQDIWEIVMGYNKSHYKDKERLFVRVAGVMSKSIDIISNLNNDKTKKQQLLKHPNLGHYPAENLTHDEALEFVRRLSIMTNIHFSLPTEDEWEYAARGGQKSQGFKYAGSDILDEVAWYRDNADGSTHPVGMKKPNELGLYDMCGNVWEWTDTPAHSYADKIEPNGKIFIRRGGSWWHKAKNCRVSRRYPSDSSKKTSGLGLRVVIRECVK